MLVNVTVHSAAHMYTLRVDFLYSTGAISAKCPEYHP